MKDLTKKIIVSISFVTSTFCFGLDKIQTKVFDLRYENGESQVFHLDSNQNPEFLNPEEFAGQYFLLRSGVKSFSTSSRRSTTYFKTIDENSCSVENSYDLEFTQGNPDHFINEKTRALRTCLLYKISDSTGGLVEFEPAQVNCTLNRIDDSNVLMIGGDCFFKAKEKQILTVTLNPNLECLNRQFLTEQKISPMEVMSQFEAFIYPEKEIGKVFAETKRLWEKRFFLNLNSGKELLKLVTKEDNQDRTFYRPAQLVYPDIMISDLRITNKTEDTSGMIDLGMLLSGFGGQDRCVDGLCSNYLNYDYPFTPLAVISQINPRTGKKQELAARFVGGRIPSKWMGEFRAITFFGDFNFEKGNKYSIELIFSDPTYDFQEFSKTYKSNLRIETLETSGLVTGRDTFTGYNRGVPGLGTIRGVEALTTIDINLFKGIPTGVLDDLPRIFESLSDPTFPPEYTHVCNKKGICREARKGTHLSLSVEFEVTDVINNQVVIGNLSVERKSPLFPSLKTKIINKPTIKCSKN